MCSSVNIEHQPASKNADTLKDRWLNNHTTWSVGEGKYEKNLYVTVPDLSQDKSSLLTVITRIALVQTSRNVEVAVSSNDAHISLIREQSKECQKKCPKKIF